MCSNSIWFGIWERIWDISQLKECKCLLMRLQNCCIGGRWISFFIFPWEANIPTTSVQCSYVLHFINIFLLLLISLTWILIFGPHFLTLMVTTCYANLSCTFHHFTSPNKSICYSVWLLESDSDADEDIRLEHIVNGVILSLLLKFFYINFVCVPYLNGFDGVSFYIFRQD